jgi:hypothetical protein
MHVRHSSRSSSARWSGLIQPLLLVGSLSLLTTCGGGGGGFAGPGGDQAPAPTETQGSVGGQSYTGGANGAPPGPSEYGAEDGWIWGPECEVDVIGLMENGEYDELSGQLHDCILNDPNAPDQVAAAAVAADDVAQERLAAGT